MKLYLVSYYDRYDYEYRDRFNTTPRRTERVYVAATSVKEAVNKVNRSCDVRKEDFASTKAVAVKTGKARIIEEFQDGYAF